MKNLRFRTARFALSLLLLISVIWPCRTCAGQHDTLPAASGLEYIFPLGAPSTAYDPACVETSIWNVMPVYQGDHMSLQGGMTRINRIRPFYLELLQMIDQLPVS